MENLTLGSASVIMIICYLMAEGIKIVFKGKAMEEKVKNLIPVFCALIGGALGFFVYFICPNAIATENCLSAVGVGVFSGLGATGSNQMIKQIEAMIKNKRG
ncbi:MAG: phage holin family protein [Clostridia bacterium]|nr:phage holin family protein [Clostridia bacterium]